MKQAKHSAGFRLHLMYTPTHAKPAPGHSRAMRAASLVSGSGLPAAERFGLPGHGGYQHVQPAEQAG